MLSPNVVNVFVVYVRNGCMNVALTSARLLFPATDQMWFAASIGPAGLLFEHDGRGAQAKFLRAQRPIGGPGIRNTGPTPQIHPPLVGAFGEKKKLCTMSPRPALLSPPGRAIRHRSPAQSCG